MRKEALINYHYDALDRLISFNVKGSESLDRFYHGEDISRQFQGDETTVFLAHDSQVLGHSNRQKRSGTLMGINQQGTVLQTISSDELQQLHYTPYGYSARDEGTHSLYGFNGEQPDPVTGCYMLGNGYRAYNPVLMRFNSPDSMSPFGAGGINPYTYCVGDPINFSDPTGHFSWKSIFKLVVAVVVIAVSIATLVVAPLSGPVALGAVADIASSVLEVGSVLFEELAPESEAGSVLGQFSMAMGALAFAAGRGVFGKTKAPTTLARQGALKGAKGVGAATKLGKKARNSVAAAKQLAKANKGADYLEYAGYGVEALEVVEDYVIPYLAPPQASRADTSSASRGSDASHSFEQAEQRALNVRSLE